MRLDGKTAVITGGGSGIGLAVARVFIEAGALLAIIGRDSAKLAAASAQLGPKAFAITADVAKPATLTRAMDDVRQKLGGIDVLFANAGTSDAPDVAGATEAAFDAFMDINLKGTIFTVTTAMPLLCDSASIILTGSVAAQKGRPGDPIYAAAKGAVRSFGRALAMDEKLLARRIRVNVVTPGAIATSLTKAATDNAEVGRRVAGMVPLGRWGDAREVAQAVLFLASNASSYMTGTEITVDGGLANV